MCCRVQEGVEDLPSGQGEVGGAGGGGVRGAALGAPAQLLGVGQVAEVVDGHQCARAGRVGRAGGRGAAASRIRAGCRGPGRDGGSGGAGGSGPRSGCPRRGPRRGSGPAASARRGGREPSVSAAARGGGRGGVKTPVSIRRRVRTASWRRTASRCGLVRQVGGALRAEHGVRDAAPGAAVAVRVGDAAAQVPAAGGGDVGGGQFGGVQGDGPLVGALVEVDAVAAPAAAAALAGAQQAAGAGGGHPQRTARRCGAGAAVPGAAGGEGVGVHGGDRARRHARDGRGWQGDVPRAAQRYRTQHASQRVVCSMPARRFG